MLDRNLSVYPLIQILGPPLKSPFLRDTVFKQYLAKMGFLRDDYL